VILGLAGPFGSFGALDLVPRLLYWLAVVFLTYAVGYGLSMFADALWGRGQPFLVRLLVMVVPAGLAATLIVTVLNLVTFGPALFSPLDTIVLLGQCYAVAIGVIVVVLLLEPRHAAPADTPTVAPPAILERVPVPQRGQLLALSVEDHYVDIVTDRGKTLVLMRLADAMRETGSVAGLQIHRSHWVAHGAVVKVHRTGGKLLVELSNGMRLPVSRGFQPAVKAAGLL
jgi:DNA-binding LytR/AlgR family response regulator